MITYSFVQLASGQFPSMLPGGSALKDGALRAQDGYIMARESLESRTLVVANTARKDEVRHVPWSSVQYATATRAAEPMEKLADKPGPKVAAKPGHP